MGCGIFSQYSLLESHYCTSQIKQNAGGVAPALFKITTKISPHGVVPRVAGLGVVGKYYTHKSPLLLHKEGGKVHIK